MAIDRAPRRGRIVRRSEGREDCGCSVCVCAARNLSHRQLSLSPSLSLCLRPGIQIEAVDLQAQKPQPTKSKTTMPTRKAPKPIMQLQRVLLRTDLPVHQLIPGRPSLGLTPIQQVGPGPANAVLDEVGEEDGEEDGDQEAEVGDVGFVGGGAEEGGPGGEDEQGDEEGVDEEVGDGDAFGGGVGVVDVDIGEVEEAVEGGDEGLCLKIGSCEYVPGGRV